MGITKRAYLDAEWVPDPSMNAKPIDTLRVSDLKKYRVWEFTTNEADPDRGSPSQTSSDFYAFQERSLELVFRSQMVNDYGPIAPECARVCPSVIDRSPRTTSWKGGCSISIP